MYGVTAAVFRVLLTDADATVNETLRYYGTLGRTGAQVPINYNLRQLGQPSLSLSLGDDIRSLVHQWLDFMPAGETANWAVSPTLHTSAIA
jgi:hypothetical protein